MFRRLASLAIAGGFIASISTVGRAADWPVFGFDPARSGFNSAEKTLTVANVHNLRERWQISLGHVADTAPILLQRVRVGRFYRSLLYETLRNGATLGIDSVTGHVVWKFTTGGPKYTHSAPAADPSGKAIYAPGVDGRVHKLNAANGHEIHGQGFPAKITLSRIPKRTSRRSTSRTVIFTRRSRATTAIRRRTTGTSSRSICAPERRRSSTHSAATSTCSSGEAAAASSVRESGRAAAPSSIRLHL